MIKEIIKTWYRQTADRSIQRTTYRRRRGLRKVACGQQDAIFRQTAAKFRKRRLSVLEISTLPLNSHTRRFPAQILYFERKFSNRGRGGGQSHPASTTLRVCVVRHSCTNIQVKHSITDKLCSEYAVKHWRRQLWGTGARAPPSTSS